jgi:hypothetical protein
LSLAAASIADSHAEAEATAWPLRRLRLGRLKAQRR